MPRVLTFVLVLLVLLCSATLLSAESYVLEVRGNAGDVAATVAAAGGTVVHDLSAEIGIVTAVSDDPDFAANLAAAGGTAVCHEDLSVQWTPTNEDFGAQAVEAPAAAGHVADPTTAFFYPCQWNMTQIDAPGAWAQGAFGNPGVKVAVLDSGVDPFHQDLTGRIDVANSVSMLSPGSSPCGPADEALFDDFGFHGTFVASQIVSNGRGIAAVAPDANVVGVKVLNCFGAGSFGDVIAGIVYAAGLPDVDVINMSLGAYFPKNLAGPLIGAADKAVNYAGSQGKLVISSSGNNSADLQNDVNFTSVPAESGSGIAIYATNVFDQLASYSNHGANATLVGAPGGDGPGPSPPLPGCVLPPILQGGVIGACSTSSIFFACGADSYLAGGAGTSFAAPIAAGVAALVDGEAGGAKDPAQLKNRLMMTADDLGRKGTDNLYSHGRVNAARAVE